MVRDLQSEVDAIGRIPPVPRILDVICSATGMGFAAVARVTEDRWIAGAVKDLIAFGLQAGGELQIETTICNEIRDHRQPVIIENVAADPIYCKHHTPATYGFQSYISVPIMLADGRFFGTLCAIHPHPAQIDTPEIREMFALFAELIAFHLDAMDQVTASRAALLDERESSRLREQFIAVIGHDLRNPLAAIDGGMRLLRREKLSEQGQRAIGLLTSTVSRMSGLVDNMLDFARGRLGGGLDAERRHVVIGPVLDQILFELREAHPDRVIEGSFDPSLELDCDPSRIGQLLSNLVGNALMHGAADAPIRVAAWIDGPHFLLSVANAGNPIPSDKLPRLFQPFERGEGKGKIEGLGLGLYITSQIAEAHGGRIDVESDADETRFTFVMPAD